MSEITINVECGFKTKNNRDLFKNIFHDFNYDNAAKKNFRKEKEILSLNNIDADDLFSGERGHFEISELSVDQNGLLNFTLWGGVHGGDAFWQNLVCVLIESGANYLFAVTYNDQVGEYWVEVLKRKKLDVVYLTGVGGECDDEFFKTDTDVPLIKRCKKLYDEKRLAMPTSDQDNLLKLLRKHNGNYVTDKLSHAIRSSENINAKDSSGDVPLNIAVRSGDLMLITFICEQGQPCCDPRVKDKMGLSALDIAKEMEKEDILTLLNETVGTYKWWEDNYKDK